VSVLFCDLVGFTPLAETKDPEDVRELLSGYFNLARAIVARYGGVVEKFIGDAVMAVWGAPVAKEDDAERAVRAALPEEGFVVGDRVNTAARIQSVAPPGCCFVDESTKRATDAAVVYDDAGNHELKGKTEPVHLYRALRIVAGVGGALKSEGLEAPFVGRDRELRLVKDLFHASAEERRAHLVSVTGIAGIGKSRLAWEFYKYLDGLSDLFRWHRGRCLSYGEGVAYWALAEMVRSRAGILEGRTPARQPRSCTPRSRSILPTPKSAAGSSRASRTSSGSRSGAPATRARGTKRISSPPGGSFSSACRRSTRS
jgi:hypothetical protein